MDNGEEVDNGKDVLTSTLKYDLQKLRLTAVDAEDGAEWRRTARVADPSPEGFREKGRERGRLLG